MRPVRTPKQNKLYNDRYYEKRKAWWWRTREIRLKKKNEYRKNHPEKEQEWREKNKDWVAERAKLYRIKNRDRIKLNKKIYNEKNKERLSRQNKEYKKRHYEHAKIIQKKWVINNRDRVRFLARERYRKNPEKMKQINRALKYSRKRAGKLLLSTIQLVYEDNIKKYGTLTCYLCKKPIVFGFDNLEHKLPISRGGLNEYNNLAVACRNCNFSKGRKTLEEYKMEVLNI